MSGIFENLPRYLYVISIETALWFVFLGISYTTCYFKNNCIYNIKSYINEFIFEFLAIMYCVFLAMTTCFYILTIMLP